MKKQALIVLECYENNAFLPKSPFCKPRTVLYFSDGFVEPIVSKSCIYNPHMWSKTANISL